MTAAGRDRTVHRDLCFAEIEGYRPLLLDLSVPADAPGPVPLLVWIHGGGWRFGSPRVGESWLGVADPVGAALGCGFAVATVQYRFSGEARWPAQRDDVAAAVRWLRQHAAELGVDPARIAAWGESAGGHLAAMLALTSTGTDSAVCAAVAWYPPTDLPALQRQAHPDSVIDHDHPGSSASRLIGAALPDAPEQAALASPLHHVSAAASPVLLMHGTRDLTIPHQQSVRLAGALKDAGAECELVLVEGADHCFAGADLREMVATSLRFLQRRC
ncbi:alpha/beta hydrolase fold domain-containing protein [Streptacidiphilus cavernicola]|uniref:Alpha/beta hydrolase fold domain-containing protein n=1 Tax=Streptacidiphilus cavernicola TaxID=3342716 RepID=A0ABV6VZY7_9ACTN